MGRWGANDKGAMESSIHIFCVYLWYAGLLEHETQDAHLSGRRTLWGTWALALSLWALAAKSAESFLPWNTRGRWLGKEEGADGVVTGYQTAHGFFEVSLAGLLEIQGWDFSRGLEGLCEQVGQEQ